MFLISFVVVTVLLAVLWTGTGALEFVDMNEYNKTATLYANSVHHHNKESIAVISDNKNNSLVVDATKKDGEKADAVTFLEIASNAHSNSTSIASVKADKKEESVTPKTEAVAFLEIASNSSAISKEAKAPKTEAVAFLETAPTASKDAVATPPAKLLVEKSKIDFLDLSPQKTPSEAAAESSASAGNVVLVTGVTGMVGSSTAIELVKQGKYKVFGLARADSSLQRITNILSNITIVRGDITDSFHLIDILAEIKPDYVLHFAAQSSNALSFDNPQLTMSVNVHGTLNLLEAIRRNGLLQTKFFYAGSWSEYGRSAEVLDGAPIPESLKLDPVSPYGLSKASAEQLTLQYFHNYHIPVIIGRFFFVLGRGTSTMIDIQDFCRHLVIIETTRRANPVITHHSNLKNQRDILHVKDAALAVVGLLTRATAGDVYNIGSGRGTSTEMLFTTLANTSSSTAINATTKDLKVTFNSQVKLQRHETFVVADTKKLQSTVPGWQPKWSVEQAVVDELNYWRSALKTFD